MTNNQFTDFLINCQSDFTNRTPHMTGSIAEYTNTGNRPSSSAPTTSRRSWRSWSGQTAVNLLATGSS